MCKCHGSIDEHVDNVITYKSNNNMQYVSNTNQTYNGNTQYKN
jgi:hypothetical protein